MLSADENYLIEVGFGFENNKGERGFSRGRYIPYRAISSFIEERNKFTKGGFNYNDTEMFEISKKIDTYDISILPYEDCCTVFVPRHPVINPNLKHIYSEEAKIDFDTLINEAVNTIEVVDLKEIKSDLL